jgi:hypothetical protein
MHDQPNAVELIAAARHYLETDLIPNLADARLRFQTLVAANVLSIVERELQTEEAQLSEEWKFLAKLKILSGSVPAPLGDLRKQVYDANVKLCEQIRAGEFDERRDFLSLSNEIRRLVDRKLEVANPKYLAGFYGESRKQA